MMSDIENEELGEEISKISEFQMEAAEAIDLVTNNLADGAKASSKFFGAFEKI